jgi:hypothetical protein
MARGAGAPTMDAITLLFGTASQLKRNWNLDPTSNLMTGTSLQDLIERIGSEHVERRLKIEAEHEAAQLFGQGLIFFNLENWYAAPWIVRTALKLAGLYGRARRNADHVVVKQHSVAFANFPRHLTISLYSTSAICMPT